MSIHHHENGADNETPGNLVICQDNETLGNLVICQDNTIHREGNNVTENRVYISRGANTQTAAEEFSLLIDSNFLGKFPTIYQAFERAEKLLGHALNSEEISVDWYGRAHK